MVDITALASNLTVNNPTGTPVNGQKMMFRYLDDATSRTLSWGNKFRGVMGNTLPSSTTESTLGYVGFIYNGNDDMWDGVAV